MPATAFYDLVKCTVTATPGTGSMTLGAAVAGYRAASGVIANGAVVSYGVEDYGAGGLIYHEVGTGTYNSGTGVLTRTLTASSTGAILNLTAAAVVYVTALAADFPFKASGAELRVGTDDAKFLTPKAVRDAIAPEGFDNASGVITPDLTAGLNKRYTLMDNITLNAPTGAVSGMSGFIIFTQGVGGKTVTFNTGYKFPGGTIPSLTSTVSSEDVLFYIVGGNGQLRCSLLKGFA